MKLASLKVRSRLALGFGLLIISLLTVGALGSFAVRVLDKSIYEITAVNNEQRRLAIDMLASIQNRAVIVRNVILVRSRGELDALSGQARQAVKRYDDARDALGTMLAQDPGTTAEENNLFRAARAAQEEAAPVFNLIIDLALKGDHDVALRTLQADLAPRQDKWLAVLSELADLELQLSQEEAREASEITRTLQIAILAVVAAAVALGALSAYAIVRSILKQLGGEPGDAQQLAGEIAAGDLTRQLRLDPRYAGSLLHSLEGMRGRLSQIVEVIKLSAESISSAAGQIAQGNSDLSQRTEEQAASLEQQAASIEELTSTVRQNEDSALSGSRLAGECAAIAEKAGDVVSKVVATMGEISGNSAKVEQIIAVIDGIAFQTNILALNAAVEAARAGESGRGFAVVASEVRSLAQRSANSAKEIKDLIERSSSVIVSGVGLAENAGQHMADVLRSVSGVSNLTGEIAAASREQTSGIDQVNVAVSQMDAMTQQNAALVEESAAAAHAMAEQARELLESVARFKTAPVARRLGEAEAPGARRAMPLLAAH